MKKQKIIKMLSRILFEFDLGRWIANIVQFVLITAIFLKTFLGGKQVDLKVVGLILVASLFFVWFLGFILRVTRIQEYYQKYGAATKEALERLERIERKIQ